MEVLTVKCQFQTQSRQDWDKTETRPREDWDKTERRLRQDRDKTKTRPWQGRDKAETRPRKDRGKTETRLRQGLDKTETRPRQDRDKTETRPRQDRDKTETKTRPRESCHSENFKFFYDVLIQNLGPIWKIHVETVETGWDFFVSWLRTVKTFAPNRNIRLKPHFYSDDTFTICWYILVSLFVNLCHNWEIHDWTSQDCGDWLRLSLSLSIKAEGSCCQDQVVPFWQYFSVENFLVLSRSQTF